MMQGASRRDDYDRDYSRRNRRRATQLPMPDFEQQQVKQQGRGEITPEPTSYTQGGQIVFGQSYISADGYLAQLATINEFLKIGGTFYEGMKELEIKEKKLAYDREMQRRENELQARAIIAGTQDIFNEPLSGFSGLDSSDYTGGSF